MTDLADLDRRVAVVMGRPYEDQWCCEGCGAWVEPDDTTPQGRGHVKLGPVGPDLCGPVSPRRTFTPTLDANDCREFERFALAHEVTNILFDCSRFAAWCAVWTDEIGPKAEKKTTPAEHGPTFDLVAVVLALLAALEAKE